MDKMDKYGMDLEKVNVERLKEIFPECVTDGKINFEALRAALGDEVETSNEKYSFNWVGKANAMKIALTPSTGTLVPCKGKSKDWDTTQNLYIEGDNLEVLKILEKTYHNKIKMIYIDPPYNTGNDFVYHDDFHDNVQNYLDNSSQAFRTNPETAGRFHTDWLNMMYPRLKVARELLADDGVIFISIDDNEQSNLKKMCEEIFANSNHIATIFREAIKGGSQSKHIRNVHDYVVCYAKNIDLIDFTGIEVDGIELNLEDEQGKYARGRELNKWGAGSRREDAPSLFYPIPGPNGEDVYPIRNDGSEGRWRLGKQKMFELLKAGNAIFEPRGDGTYIVYQKIRDNSPKIKQFTTLFSENYINAKGTEEIKSLFQQTTSVFDFSKPSILIKDLIRMSNSTDGIILDFFSGSATTAHAVMQLNAEDGGNRKFIMVQLPEKCDEKSEAFKAGYDNICEIGEERIRRAGEKIKEALRENGTGISMLANGAKNKKNIVNEDGETVAQISMTGMFDAPENVDEANNEMADKIDVGFKVFRLDSTNIKPWDATVKYDEQTIFELNDSVVKEDRSNLDVAYEVMLKYGVFNMPLEERIVNGKTVYSVGDGYMIISLNDEITTDDVLQIAMLKPKAVVFKESGFVDDNAKMNADYTFKRLGIDNVKCI